MYMEEATKQSEVVQMGDDVVKDYTELIIVAFA